MVAIGSWPPIETLPDLEGRLALATQTRAPELTAHGGGSADETPNTKKKRKEKAPQ